MTVAFQYMPTWAACAPDNAAQRSALIVMVASTPAQPRATHDQRTPSKAALNSSQSILATTIATRIALTPSPIARPLARNAALTAARAR
jgi:hypothetical protein